MFRAYRMWLLMAVVALVSLGRPSRLPAEERPNFIVVFVDNLGYGDVACFHPETLNRTPNLDQMAAEGLKLTSFYSTSGVCTPSRASLMTGCYPRRVGMQVGWQGGVVLFPGDKKGISADEITIAQVLGDAGYATKIIGKWHLGDQPPFFPTRHGFDSFFGIPYSDDMTGTADGRRPPLPLMEDERVIEAPPDRNKLTKRYTERAIEFIREHRDRPFFLYLPHAMPGSTRAPFASERFRGRSENGPWGDSVEELDWSMGEILAALQRMDLDERTLVLWTSDNGAPRHAPPGSNLPLKGWGYTTAEGGQRVPCIVRWPGRIPAGSVSDKLTTTMDLLPTLAYLAGTEPPQDRVIDGHDIRPLLFGEPDAQSPYEAFFYYYLEQLQAVRAGHWKLYLPLENRWYNFRRHGRPAEAELYDLKNDLQETRNLADAEPEVVERLLAYAERAREELGDEDRQGTGQREPGWVEEPQLLRLAD